MTNNRVPSLFIESAFDADAQLTYRLGSDGGLLENTVNVKRGFAPTSQAPELASSPYRAELSCKCGAKNVDNVCVAAGAESKPYEGKTPAQTAWFQGLWTTQAPQPLQPTELLLMARAGPQY